MPQYYCDRAGNAVTADEALDAAGNLRNGFGMRVPLQLCDSMQRDVAEFYDGKRRTRTQYRDPQGREAGTSETEEERRNPAAGASVTLPVASLTAGACSSPPISACRPPSVFVDHMEGRDEMLRQMYRDGRAEVDKARQ